VTGQQNAKTSVAANEVLSHTATRLPTATLIVVISLRAARFSAQRFGDVKTVKECSNIINRNI
jgi:hypothetical protein